MTRTVVNPLVSSERHGRRSDVRRAQLPARRTTRPTACTRTTRATRSSPREVVRAITSSSYPSPQSSCAAHDDRSVTVRRCRCARLERGLRRELPGPTAQARLAPVPRRAWPAGFNPARIRDAAGLLLVFPATSNQRRDRRRSAERSRFSAGSAVSAFPVATRRTSCSPCAPTRWRHGGQVSLPGGVVEPGETFEQAALREAHEEVGAAARRRARARRADAARHSRQRLPPAPDRRRQPRRARS